MKTQQPYLSDFFAKARSEAPVISEQEIDRLLDEQDLHGRQTAREDAPQTMAPVHSNNRKRRIVMGSITALLFGTCISAGIFFFNPGNAERHSPIPVVAGSTSTAGQEAAVANEPVVSAPLSSETVSGSSGPVAGKGDGSAANIGDADNTGDEKRKDGEKSDIEQRISQELRTFVENYWIDRINDYKARIDGLLSSEDRDELNRLRVRWALVEKEESGMDFGAMMSIGGIGANGEDARFSTSLGNSGEMESLDLPELEEGENGRVSLGFSIKGSHSDEQVSDDGKKLTTTTVRRHDNVVVIRKGEGDAQTDEVNAKVKVEVGEEEDIEIDREGNHTIIVRKKSIGNDAEGMNGTLEIGRFDLSSMAGMVKMAIRADENESSRIIVAAWNIADAYRPGLDDLKAALTSDVTNFVDQLRKRMSDFVDEHGDELPAEIRDAMTQKLEGEGASDPATTIMGSLAPFYEVIVEPMLLLYNGSDINGVLTSAIAEPVAGITLEANSTLKQSYPNPAGSEATIEYRLQEPSASTVLRLFDAQGSEVRKLNLGPKSAGNHQANVDVKDLPGGTYLYHLTVGTGHGEQVFSKTLQVAR